VEAEEPHPAPGLFAGSSSTDPQQLTDAERLRAQRELQILDTPREDRFARVVRLARRLFGVPMVVVALVENDGRGRPRARAWTRTADPAVRRSAMP
jgi:hypothetical protein